MRAVAQRGSSILVRLSGEGDGTAVVVTPASGAVGRPMFEPSVVAWGYWRDIADGELADAALGLADAELVAAAWDESRVRRYPRGTRVEGPRGGGRFAPKETTAVENEVEEPTSPVGMGEVAPAGTPIAVLVEGNRFWLGGKEHQVIRWDGDRIVVETAGEGVERTLPVGFSSAMAEAPPAESRITVTGRSLKPGSRFWVQDRYGNVEEYVVPTEGPGAERSASGLSRYVTVERVTDGKRQIMKRSVKVLVDPADFPAAAKRAAAVSVSHVTGQYGAIFEKSPGKGAAVTKGMNEASAELTEIGVTLPADMPKISALKETKALTMGGVFHAEVSRASGAVVPEKTHIAIRRVDETAADMRDTSHHEVGHYLDFMVLGNQSPEAASGGVPYFERYASSIRDPQVAGPVMDAIDRSEAWKRIETMTAESDRYSIVSNRGDQYERAWPIDRQHLTYLRDPTERFARAWEQYVATRVGDKRGLTEFAPRMARYRSGAAAPASVTKLVGSTSYRSGEAPIPVSEYESMTDDHHSFYGWYWTEDDFRPIADEFDAMLRRLGWLKG